MNILKLLDALTKVLEVQPHTEYSLIVWEQKPTVNARLAEQWTIIAIDLELTSNQQPTSSREAGIMDYTKYKTKRKIYSAWPNYDEYVTWLRNYQLDLCFICMLPLADKVHIDHIKPLYNGGSNGLKNMALTHPKCNITKGISEMLGKSEVSWRKHKLIVIKEGIELYKRQATGFKPKPHQADKISLAVEYLGLDYLNLC